MPTGSNSTALNLSARIPELDGIRGIAIGVVLIHHFIVVISVVQPATAASYLLVPLRLCWSGVDLFFVLSGFLIGGILLDARKSSNYYRVFYTRRFFRIVPIYTLLLLFSLALAGALQFGWAQKFSWMLEGHMPWYTYPLFLQNFWMVPRSVLGAPILSITWTLAIEEQFYLTLPVIVRVFASRRLLVVVLGGIVAAPVFRILLFRYWNTQFLSWTVLMPCRADTLLLGVLGAIAMRSDTWRSWLRKNRNLHAALLLLFAVGFVYLDLRASGSRQFVMASAGYSWIALFYFCGLMYAVMNTDSLLSLCLRWRPLMWLGTISYGLYLIHNTVLGFVYTLVWSKPPRLETIAALSTSMIALVLALIVSRISWVYFEKRLVGLGHKIHYRFEPAVEKSPIQTPIVESSGA